MDLTTLYVVSKNFCFLEHLVLVIIVIGPQGILVIIIVFIFLDTPFGSRFFDRDPATPLGIRQLQVVDNVDEFGY